MNENKLILLIILVTVAPTLFGIFFVIVSERAWKRKKQEIIDELGLVEGCVYDILQNGGHTINGLAFVKIYRGNRSINGNINLLFIKNTSYRGNTIERETVIKYGSIWKITKL